MTFKTHLNGGLLASLLICGDVPSAMCVIAGSVLPDIDHRNGILGKCFPLIPRILTHRGVTHSVPFIILAYVISPYLSVGVAVHVLMDMMTRNGVRLYYPLKARISLPGSSLVSTGGKFETALFMLMSVAVSWRIVTLLLS